MNLDKLKELIRELLSQQLQEMNVTGGGEAFATPKFVKKKKSCGCGCGGSCSTKK